MGQFCLDDTTDCDNLKNIRIALNGSQTAFNRKPIILSGLKFKKYLKKVRAYSIDMETATLFT